MTAKMKRREFIAHRRRGGMAARGPLLDPEQTLGVRCEIMPGRAAPYDFSRGRRGRT